MKKKILIVSPMALPVPDVMGGAIERLITMLIEENEKEQLCDFCVISSYNEEAARLSSSYKHCDVRYIKPSGKLIRYLCAKTFAVLRRVFRCELPILTPSDYRVLETIRKVNPHYVVSVGGGQSSLCYLAKTFAKEKFYLQLHWTYSPSKVIERTFGNFIAVSDFIRKNWIAHLSNKNAKTFLVRNSIDETRFNHSISPEKRKLIRENFGFSDEDFVVLFVGRLIPEKGIKELLDAFTMIKQPDIKLLVIGSVNFAGKEETDFSRLIRKRIEDMSSVKFCGYVDNSELCQYYRSCDLMAVPSVWEEASGLVSIEAMHSGLPLVVTRSGGLTENVDENCAVILDKDNGLAENLALSIESLASDPERRRKMSEASLKRAELFTRNKFYHDFMRVFEL